MLINRNPRYVVTLKTGLLVANSSSLAGVVKLPTGRHHQGKVSSRAHLPHLLVNPKVNLHNYKKNSELTVLVK
jgi:hypothetical protein